jgi:hypothetical protein
VARSRGGAGHATGAEEGKGGWGRCWDGGVDEEVSRLLESGASGMVEETGAGGGDRGQAGGSGSRGIRGRAGRIRRPAVCAAAVHG